MTDTLHTYADALEHFGAENIASLPGFREEPSGRYHRYDEDEDDWVECVEEADDARPVMETRFAPEVEAFLGMR